MRLMSTEKTPPPVILGRYAGFFSRGAAYALDRLTTFGITVLITAVLHYFLSLFRIDQWLEGLRHDTPLYVVLAVLLSTVGIHILVSVTYNIGFWLISGQTPGKRMLGVRVMRADGTRLKLGNAVRRQIGYWISSILYLGFLWILFDNRRRGWHDKLAGTIVTYSWPEGKLKGTFVIKHMEHFTGKRSQT
jgi:uncharacterized RDD family membrane protein YckC